MADYLHSFDRLYLIGCDAALEAKICPWLSSLSLSCSEPVSQSMLTVEVLKKWQADLSLKGDEVDLTNCDREPIHIPGMIQPHGVLLVLEAPTFRVIQVSANVEKILGLSVEQLLGSSLSQWFAAEQVEKLHGCIEQDFDSINPLKFCETVSGQLFNGIAHRSGDAIILELELIQHEKSSNFFDFYNCVKAPLNRLQRAETVDELCQLVTQEVKRICGFDRVMVYRFKRDGSGCVIAETCREDLEPFLGLHYPDSDIPRQAKLLYVHNKLRLIPNRCYEPVQLVPELNPITQVSTDLSYSILRSVSPVHLEYLGNMGVTASMSISLVQNGNLWGLIACHHCSPRQIDYELRAVSEFVGQVAALEIVAKEKNATLDYRISLSQTQANLIQAIAQSKELISAMARPELLSLVNADGAIIVQGEQQILIGQTPSEMQTTSLVNYLEKVMGNEVVYQTSWLSSFHPEAEDYASSASGMLVVCVSKVQRVYLLWFRQEMTQTVNWGGNPTKELARDEEGEMRILPRKSFALWKEIVKGRSADWLTCEIEMAQKLRTNILGLLLRNADELASVNKELSRSNDELDAFAYIASHDLKEPLRGIYNYSSFLIEDYEHQLDDDGVHKLQTLMRLTKRMEDLIDSLLHFSRLGRVELNSEKLALDQLLSEVLDTFEISRKTKNVEIKTADNLPEIEGDSVQINELYSNLISNAIKYNSSEQKKIEIGVLQGEEARKIITHQGLGSETNADVLLYVRDNGIGIRERHLTSVFRIFKRLHAPKRYGGGTGAGLTIVKKIVERHGGVIWVESVYGEGSTFYFTLF